VFSRITGDGDFEVVMAKNSREAFEIIGNRLWRLDLIVVDVDAEGHGLALLEAISACAQRPPIIVVTALEEVYMKAIAAAHGAAACLGKPLKRAKLLTTCRRVSANKGLTCDRWGSLLPRPYRSLDLRKRFKGITTKLSPRIAH
jgi:DNA-binding NtrC family response regulator